MNQKGQVAIEFIMLILIIIIYLLTITRPLIADSKDLTNDVQTIVRADAETKRIANSVTEVAMLGEGSKKTLLLFIPENVVISCDETENLVGFDMNLEGRPVRLQTIKTSAEGDPPEYECDSDKTSCCLDGKCNKNYPFDKTKVNLDCQKTIMKGENNVIIINDGVNSGTTTISITG